MPKGTFFCELKYEFEEEGFSISIYEVYFGSYVQIKYEKDISIFYCNNNFEAALLMHRLLCEYEEKKRIVERIINLI